MSLARDIGVRLCCIVRRAESGACFAQRSDGYDRIAFVDTADGNVDIAGAKAIQNDIAEKFARCGIAAVTAAPAPMSAPSPAAAATECSRA